jgi:hypothetical protein
MLIILSKLSITLKHKNPNFTKIVSNFEGLEAVFRCSFADVDGKAYSYDVYWYINEQSVVTHRRLAYNNIDQSLLRPDDWVGQYQMNMVVRICM